MKNQIREIREERGLSQGELAALAGVSRATVNHAEQADLEMVRVGTLRQLADALGVAIDDLFFQASVKSS